MKSDKPARKTLGLKRAVAKSGNEQAGAAREERRPLRWSSRQRDRSRPVEAEPAAEPEQGRGRKGAGVGEKRRPAAARKPARAEAGGTRRQPGKGRGQVQAFFAPCPRGLEDELAKELTELGADQPIAASGGVSFSGPMPLAWKVNLWSRLAIRVLWRVDEGPYRREEDLYDAALALPWPAWFHSERSIAVRTVAHACPLKSLNFVSLKIKDAVCDRFRQEGLARPNVETHNPDVPLLLYLEHDQYSLYVDLSGEPLNRRGYRVEPAPAPLNENLAAGLLRLAGWTPEVPLLDPMMGGGTILIEAALLALNIAPGLKRRFACEHLANFDRVEWARLRKDAQALAADRRQLRIYGCDVDPRMVRAAGLNLRAAGVEDCISIDAGNVLDIHAPEPTGLIVSNPPYGVRLQPGRAAIHPQPDGAVGHGEPDDFARFYRALGDALKQRFAGWTAFLLSADPGLAKDIGLRTSRRVPLYNGPLECRLYEYRLLAGSTRSKPD